MQVEGSNLYFSTEEKLNIVDGDKLSAEFVSAFKKASSEIVNRFADKQYSDYRVSIVEGYALKVQLPVSEGSDKAGAALSFSVKLIVSAEILANTAKSLGGMMQDARLYELPQLFALVAVAFLAGLLMETLVGLLAEYVEKKVK